MPKPLAVFCYCDYDAAKFEAICLEAGYAIPDDIAILGVDNDTLVCENIRVPLSSVRHDLVRIGYEGAALLNRLDILEDLVAAGGGGTPTPSANVAAYWSTMQ